MQCRSTRWLFCGLAAFTALLLSAQAAEESEASVAEKRQALRNGALAKVNLHVVDVEGNDIPDANVSLNLLFHDDSGTTTFGLSDGRGMFSVRRRCTGPVEYTVAKDGFYRTSGSFNFYKPLEPCVADGRWLPWDNTIKVMLKEKRNPIPMFARWGRFTFPVRDEPIGYDFLADDFVAPHGRGKYADLTFEFVYTPGASGHYADFTRELLIRSSKPGDGMIVMDSEPLTEMISIYEAPQEGYQPELRLLRTRTPTNIVEEIELTQEQYLIFRSRSITNEYGVVTNAHYGKIYGPMGYGASAQNTNGFIVDLKFYMNPVPNSRNIEYAVGQNLLGARNRVLKP